MQGLTHCFIAIDDHGTPTAHSNLKDRAVFLGPSQELKVWLCCEEREVANDGEADRSGTFASVLPPEVEAEQSSCEGEEARKVDPINAKQGAHESQHDGRDVQGPNSSAFIDKAV